MSRSPTVPRYLVLLSVLTMCAEPLGAVEFQRGDINQDGTVSLADVQFYYEWTFRGGPAPGCRDAADSNDDGIYSPRDGVWIFRHLVLDDRPPPPPFPNAGDDPTNDSFDCAEYAPAATQHDESARLEIHDATGVAAAAGGFAELTVAVSSSRALAAWYATVRDVDGILADSSNDRLIPRPPDEPDLSVEDLSAAVRIVDGNDRSGLIAARVLAGSLKLGAVPVIQTPSRLPPGESIDVLRLEIPLRAGVAPGAHRFRVERAELVDVDGNALDAPGGEFVLDVVAGPTFARGDCNGDGVAVEVSDAHFLLNFNFLGGAPPACFAACDADGDGVVTGQTTDAVFLLRFAFLGGPPPPAPFPGCGGPRSAPDVALGCVGPPDCR